MADKIEKTEERTIRHASFKYTDANGHHQVALRGQTAAIPVSEIERGEKYDAFLSDTTDELEKAGTPETPTAESTDEEFKAFVRDATVPEIEAFLHYEDEDGSTPNYDFAERILEAEYQVAKDQEKDPRTGVVKTIEQVVAARSQ